MILKVKQHSTPKTRLSEVCLDGSGCGYRAPPAFQYVQLKRIRKAKREAPLLPSPSTNVHVHRFNSRPEREIRSEIFVMRAIEHVHRDGAQNVLVEQVLFQKAAQIPLPPHK
eukprot:2885988-Pleurochrysis_carterae.AAC.1